jgi:nucleolar protein 16
MGYMYFNMIISYAALGLVSSLNPSASGGSERELCPPQQRRATITEPTPQDAQPTKIPRGYGKIIRDQDGNVIDIELAEEDEGETMEEGRSQDIGELDRTPIDESLMSWIQLGHGPPESSSVVEGE